MVFVKSHKYCAFSRQYWLRPFGKNHEMSPRSPSSNAKISRFPGNGMCGLFATTTPSPAGTVNGKLSPAVGAGKPGGPNGLGACGPISAVTGYTFWYSKQPGGNADADTSTGPNARSAAVT